MLLLILLRNNYCFSYLYLHVYRALFILAIFHYLLEIKNIFSVTGVVISKAVEQPPPLDYTLFNSPVRILRMLH